MTVVSDLKELLRFEQSPFVKERNVFRTRFFLWRRDFAQNVGILWDHLPQSSTF